jgi:hypothetical protein
MCFGCCPKLMILSVFRIGFLRTYPLLTFAWIKKYGEARISVGYYFFWAFKASG